VTNGSTLQSPGSDVCPEEVAKLMTSCWKRQPHDRLSIKEIHYKLDRICMSQPTYLDLIAWNIWRHHRTGKCFGGFSPAWLYRCVSGMFTSAWILDRNSDMIYMERDLLSDIFYWKSPKAQIDNGDSPLVVSALDKGGWILSNNMWLCEAERGPRFQF
jgi:hypothetical protein